MRSICTPRPIDVFGHHYRGDQARRYRRQDDGQRGAKAKNLVGEWLRGEHRPRPDDRLQTQIQSKKPILWLIKGEVDYELSITEDQRRLTDYYRGLGFSAPASVTSGSTTKSKSWMTLTFHIDEGPRYVVNSVSVIGNSKLESEKLTKNLKLTGGDFFDQSKLTKDIAGVQDKYGEVGYIFADVQPENWRFHKARATGPGVQNRGR